jgi:hypothetical protein
VIEQVSLTDSCLDYKVSLNSWIRACTATGRDRARHPGDRAELKVCKAAQVHDLDLVPPASGSGCQLAKKPPEQGAS